MVVASTMVIAGGLSLIHKTFFKEVRAAATNGVHMDIGGDPEEELPRRLVLVRAARFYGWFVLFLLSMAVIGLLPTVPLVIMAFMRIEGREPWRLSAILAASVTLLLYIVFHRIIHVPWPTSLMGDWFPILREVVPSM